MPDPLGVSAWLATEDDLEILIGLYRSLEAEQVALKALWPLADGLPEPVATAFKDVLDDADTRVYLGGLDGVALGFLIARVESLLPQADGVRVGVVTHIFTDHEARGVGVGDAMLTRALAELRAQGLTLFDAKVLPGHRNAKNFFEAAGFSARLIVMHHADEPEA